MICLKRKSVGLLSLFILLLAAPAAIAQPVLPDMVGVTQKGLNILSWTSPYDHLKSIAVQRSADSTFNWGTIGYVKELKKGAQAYIDGHPMPGTNWYRLQIVFGSDLNWFSNRMKLYVDSAQLLMQSVMPTNDSLQKLAANVHFNDTTGLPTTAGAPKPILSVTIPDINGVDAYAYIKSQYVFTNPFTGHVNVEIKDVKEFRYGLKFFDQNDKDVLDIPYVPEDAIIIDKRNFPHKGIFKFELSRNREKLETGYITIY
ncbi:MAG: hypothetical protein ABI378_15800 [Chitinophagaceae bacterium]